MNLRRYHSSPDNRADRERSCPACPQIHEPAVVREPPVSEQPSEHRQRLVRECLVHERLGGCYSRFPMRRSTRNG